MLKHALCLAVLVLAPLHVAAQPPQETTPNPPPQETTPNPQIVRSTDSVPIRNSPPTPWLLGFPGWEVARTNSDEFYTVLSSLEIHAFSSTHTWAKVELVTSDGDPKSGWVYLGDSSAGTLNFETEDGAW